MKSWIEGLRVGDEVALFPRQMYGSTIVENEEKNALIKTVIGFNASAVFVDGVHGGFLRNGGGYSGGMTREKCSREFNIFPSVEAGLYEEKMSRLRLRASVSIESLVLGDLERAVDCLLRLSEADVNEESSNE